MEKYNYQENVTKDVLAAIKERYTDGEIKVKLQERDMFEEELRDELWIDDSVTGNASGSYTFNTWDAEENLCHNLDLLNEALSEFGYDGEYNILDKGAEWCDVTIRCYLLGTGISEALDKLEMEV